MSQEKERMEGKEEERKKEGKKRGRNKEQRASKLRCKLSVIDSEV